MREKYSASALLYGGVFDVSVLNLYPQPRVATKLGFGISVARKLIEPTLSFANGCAADRRSMGMRHFPHCEQRAGQLNEFLLPPDYSMSAIAPHSFVAFPEAFAARSL